jgi:hypothetical protein
MIAMESQQASNQGQEQEQQLLEQELEELDELELEHQYHDESEHKDEEMEQVVPRQPILVVETTDVIMGRGLGPRQHAGNCRYKITVEMHRARYEAASSRPEKTRIADEIVAIVKQTGRFLKRDTDSGAWIELDDMQARAKVGQVRFCFIIPRAVYCKVCRQ